MNFTLETRICDLNLKIKGSRVALWVGEFYEELRLQGFEFKPEVWVSDEWFSPDGSCGIAIPFYLLDRRLLNLEKSEMGIVEGASKAEFKKLIRHEAGHAFDHAYGLMSKKLSVRYFGSQNKMYPVTYKPNLLKKEFVNHLSDLYAQSHPCEDFAETFAVCLKGERYWERQYKNQTAINKLKFMNELISKYKGKAVLKKAQFILDSINENTMTLGQYYKKKKAHRLKSQRQGRILM